MSDAALILPTSDLSPLVRLVSDAVTSPHTKRAYTRALRDFTIWYAALEPGPFSRRVVQQYRTYLEQTGRGRSSVNQSLSAIRKLADEAREGGLMDEAIAAGVCRLKGVKTLGQRTGNWLEKGEAVNLLALPNRGTLRGKRDAVALGLLVGCGLRRSEACAVDVEHIQARDGRACIVDLIGKGGRVRTVPMPAWVAADLQVWLMAARIDAGPVLRRVGGLDGHGQDGQVGGPLSSDGIWKIVKGYAVQVGRPELAPHDLRRTFARLAKRGGAGMQRIQYQLGHATETTTAGYVGADVDLSDAACDYLGVKP
jgi:integrase